jgi:hypothetical protein
VPDGVAGRREAPAVTELGPDGHCGDGADPILLRKRSAAGLASSEAGKGSADRLELVVDAVDAAEGDADSFAARWAEALTVHEPAPHCRGQNIAVDVHPLMEEGGMDALLPGDVLVDEVLIEAHPRAHLLDMLGRDPGLRQGPRGQELAQMASVDAISLGVCRRRPSVTTWPPVTAALGGDERGSAGAG